MVLLIGLFFNCRSFINVLVKDVFYCVSVNVGVIVLVLLWVVLVVFFILMVSLVIIWVLREMMILSSGLFVEVVGVFVLIGIEIG